VCRWLVPFLFAALFPLALNLGADRARRRVILTLQERIDRCPVDGLGIRIGPGIEQVPDARSTPMLGTHGEHSGNHGKLLIVGSGLCIRVDLWNPFTPDVWFH
jgi:hypothetical protein